MEAIYSLKYTGSRLGNMTGIQFSGAVEGLMAKFTAIAGWRIPDMPGIDKYQKVFEDQLNKYVWETCGDLTIAELEYAIRRYGVNLSDWGRPMHLGLIDPCVSQYKAQRQELSNIEECSLIEQKQPEIESLPVQSEDWSELWRNVLYAAKNGQIKVCWIPTDLYEWIIRENIIPEPTAEEKWDIMRQCAGIYLGEIEEALLSGNGTEPTYEIKRRINLLKNTTSPIWKKDTDIMSTLKVMAKREAVRQAAIIHCSNEEI